MCVGLHRLTQAGPEKPGQPYTRTALLHKIEGKEQRAEKKSGIFQGTNYEFLFKTHKNKEKVFLLQSLFSLCPTCTSLSPPIQ